MERVKDPYVRKHRAFVVEHPKAVIITLKAECRSGRIVNLSYQSICTAKYVRGPERRIELGPKVYPLNFYPSLLYSFGARSTHLSNYHPHQEPKATYAHPHHITLIS